MPNSEIARSRLILAAAAALLLYAAAACSEPSAASSPNLEEVPVLDHESPLTVQLAPGLEQTVTLENERLQTGDVLTLRSVVRNVSNEYKKAEALVCHLEIRTDLDWDPYDRLILCFAYSMSVRLAPRDSLVLTASGKVNSPPGRYVMVVRHLLRPDITTRVRVNVFPRASGAGES